METENNKNSLKYEIYPRTDKRIGAQPIRKKRVLIGRGQACDIVLPYRDISPIHAVLEVVSDGKFHVYDMNSSGGTTINGKSEVSAAVNRGDILSFAGYEFEIRPFVSADILPPPLEILSIEKVEAKRSLPSRPQTPQNVEEFEEKNSRITPIQRDLPSSLSEFNNEMPFVEYPLAKDPKAEFSEYIFEDADTLYPIFHYEMSRTAVEIIVAHKNRIHSIDYISDKEGVYNLVGSFPKKSEIEFPYLGLKDKFPIVEIQGGGIIIHPLPGYERFFIGDKDKKDNSHSFNLEKDEIIRFSNSDIQIFVRSTEAPPVIDHAPILRRDQEFKKYLLLMLFLVFSFVGSLSFLTVDKELEEEKTPERIAKILYKRKVTKLVPRSVQKTPKAPKRLQKAPQKVVKKETKDVKKVVKKPQKVVTKPKEGKVGSKKAPKKVGKLKKANPKKGPKNNRTKVTKNVNKKAGGKGKTSASKSSTKKAAANSKSKGRVETYKSFDFKSTVNNILSKGGQATSAATASSSESSIGESSIAEADPSATAERAKVSNNVGNIAGKASGTLDSKRGTGDLVNKHRIYTAGLPFKTVIRGGLDPDVIREILIANIPKFRYCYQRELDKAASSFNGVVSLNFIIGASGHVSRAGVASKSALPAKVKGCVVNVLRGIKFPEPLGGGVVEVNQPMNFYPRSK